LYLPELPLRTGPIMPLAGLAPGCIEDAAPDSWGQRVILNRRFGRAAQDTANLTVLEYLMKSGSDRIGALDFQASAEQYVPRVTGIVALSELAESADLVERNVPLTPALADALLRGSSIGGARRRPPSRTARDGSPPSSARQPIPSRWCRASSSPCASRVSPDWMSRTSN
jgi:serine/threonine-protein kinase HipA